MTCKHGARLKRRLPASIALLLFVGCSSSGTDGSGGTTSRGGSGGGSGSTGGTSDAGSGGGAGTGGATGGGGLNDGGIDGRANDSGIDGGRNDGGSFTCPTMPVPGNCAPPADIRCPYPKLSLTS